MSKFSFKKGFSQLTIRDVKSARKELMEALGIGTRAGFLKRLKGEVEPKASEVEKIEEVFDRYGIHDVWGE
jgi:hypothetical protein